MLQIFTSIGFINLEVYKNMWVWRRKYCTYFWNTRCLLYV